MPALNGGWPVYLVQLLLPRYDNDGNPFDTTLFGMVRRELIDRFGGVTAYTRAPASGAWSEENGGVVRDDILIYEVMAPELERDWWAEYRETLRGRFQQDELVVRASRIELL
jgi:hypothetical protein